jgi:hypothetical protein
VLNRLQVKSALEEKAVKKKYHKKVSLNLDAASDNKETDNATIKSEDSANDTDSTNEDKTLSQGELLLLQQHQNNH